MALIAYGDESGIHKVGYACYGIGALVLPLGAVPEAEAELSGLCAEFKLTQELKWSGISKFRAAIEVAVQGTEFLLRGGAALHAIVVEKATFKKWSEGDREEAFYTTYHLLAKNISRAMKDDVILRIDERSDEYPHRLEVLHQVTNRALAKIASSGTVTNVEKVDSKAHRLVQFAEILVGAVTADTNQFLGGSNALNEGKKEVVRRVAEHLGWDALRYDTMPNSHVNIWHFPPEFRARPRTRSVRIR